MNKSMIAGLLAALVFAGCRTAIPPVTVDNNYNVVPNPPEIAEWADIEKGSPRPSDFDEFWDNARAKLAAEVPLDAKIRLVPERTTDKFDFYRIDFATFGRRVYGYMSVPKARGKDAASTPDAASVKYSVEIQVSAAGFGGWTNNVDGEPNHIKVFFAVYDWEPDWKWKEKNLEAKYDAMNDEYKKKYHCNGYSTAGITESREAYYFYPVILGIDRAVDWICSRPDVDLSRVWYQGTSQGGGFGFYLCGLNRHFTKAVFYVPAITDTMGYLKGRNSGWPLIIESNSSTPELKAAAEKNAPYFDAANFGKRITIPVRVAAGLADKTCRPYCVTAAYNEIASRDKAIIYGKDMPHGVFGKVYEHLGKWLREE